MRAKLIGAVLAAFVIPLAMLVTIEAGELPSKGKIAAPTQAAAQDAPRWTGFNANAAIGYAFTSSEIGIDGVDLFSQSTGNVLGTVGLGYDVQVSNMVVGLMGDITVTDLQEPHWQWFVGARGGVLLTPRTLAYGLVGYTEALDGQLAFSLTDTSIKDLAGLTFGGGLEHQAEGGWALRAEYRYVSFGTAVVPETDGLIDADTGEHQVRLGVVKRF